MSRTNLEKHVAHFGTSILSCLGIWYLNLITFHLDSIIVFSRRWRSVSGSFRSFTQYRTSSTLVANMGILFVTSICVVFVFIGAGNITFPPSNKFSKSDQSILPPFRFCVHLRSFRKIRLLLFTPSQPNVELAGF